MRPCAPTEGAAGVDPPPRYPMARIQRSSRRELLGGVIGGLLLSVASRAAAQTAGAPPPVPASPRGRFRHALRGEATGLLTMATLASYTLHFTYTNEGGAAVDPRLWDT